MFESLSEKLQSAFARLGGRGVLSEEVVDKALHEVQLALLEADVNYRVVKGFIARVRERATGSDILKGLEPAQQVIKIVDEELTALLGGDDEATKLVFAPKPPTIIMLVGLQGSGKTTHAGKLAAFVRKQGRNPILVACDVYRPAAIKQLEIVGEQVKTPVFTKGDQIDPVDIAQEAVAEASTSGRDVVIIDTAGRLQIDDALMDELKRMKAAVKPTQILLVLDAMTGQEAVNVAKGFTDSLDVDGFILTKFDSDTRGGAALSLKTIANKPIKFIGVGEKMDALEAFHPDRMASRILGMGDILSLIEKVETEIDQEQAAAMEKKLRANRFNFEDFLEQMQQIRKLGPLDKLLGLLPGVGTQLKDVQFDEKQIKRVEAMILSMTPGERNDPSILSGSRRRRIAAGSGTTLQEINNLVSRFEQMRKIIGRGLNDPRAMQAAQAGGSPFALPGVRPDGIGKHAASNRRHKNNKKQRKLPFGR
ncbi:MAG: signal recognition particle protein [Capsulimonadaceae bacterium]|nr:signal recognition particle protein [Capsulimonadaceae bacterium]